MPVLLTSFDKYVSTVCSIFTNTVKVRLSLAAIALAAIAQPSLANPTWEVKHDGSTGWDVRKTESGVTTNYPSVYPWHWQGMEFFVDDGDLKILSYGHQKIYVFDEETGNLTSSTYSSQWMEIPGSGTSSITSLSDSSGKNIIRKDASGAIHIGENSLVTIEEGGVKRCGQQMQLVKA